MTTPISDIAVRPVEAQERPWLAAHLTRVWRAPEVVTRGRVHDAATLPALVCVAGDEVLGVATYCIDDGQCEVVTIDALHERRGAGSALLQAIVAAAGESGCRRVWVITTNDNRGAQRFYKHHGMRLVAVYEDTLKHARRHKPSIPLIGDSGIAMRDEVEFELEL
jgi:ribosomal protein S18 acetylase RimI-like enzyme